MSKPLAGVKVVELAGLAPAPFCGMILADYGADVVRVDRPNKPSLDTLSRGKRSIELDLKKEEGVACLKELCKTADVVIEPFRAGVMEKLGLDPQRVLIDQVNSRLIVARLTGFGQSGPLAPVAGHDINYIAIAGVLGYIGRAGERPMFPLNLLGDFAGGGLVCALGILIALYQRQQSGRGQVIDCAMIDGAAYINSFAHSSPVFTQERGKNIVDSGASFYEVYETADGKHMSVGAIEPQFYARFLQGLGLTGEASLTEGQYDSDQWPARKELIAAEFRKKSQAEWTEIFGNADACVQPILEGEDLYRHPHVAERQMFFEEKGSGARMPSLAPRLSAMSSGVSGVAVHPQGRRPEVGEHTREVLEEAGFSPAVIRSLIAAGAIPQPEARL